MHQIECAKSFLSRPLYFKGERLSQPILDIFQVAFAIMEKHTYAHEKKIKMILIFLCIFTLSPPPKLGEIYCRSVESKNNNDLLHYIGKMLRPPTYSNKENSKHEIHLLLFLAMVDNMSDGKLIARKKKNQEKENLKQFFLVERMSPFLVNSWWGWHRFLQKSCTF